MNSSNPQTCGLKSERPANAPSFNITKFEEKISLLQDRTTSRIKIIIDIILYLGAADLADKEMILLNAYFKNMDLTIHEERSMVDEVELIIEKCINNLIDLISNRKKNEQQIDHLNKKIKKLKHKMVKSLSIKIRQAKKSELQELDVTAFLNKDFIYSELSPRLINILLKNKLINPEDLLDVRKEELLNLKNFGKKSYATLESYFLKHTGLTIEQLKNNY